MRQNATLIAILVVTLGLIAWLAKSGGKSTATQSSSLVVPRHEVGRIELIHSRDEVIRLDRTRRGWLIDGKYAARVSSVDPLLEVLELMELKYIPTSKATENILWDIGAHGIETHVYDLNGGLMTSFVVGGSTNDELGTHVLPDGSTQPLVMYLPTMDGSFRARFTLTVDDWRDRHFIEFSANDVLEVKVDFPKQQSQSFVLQKERNDIHVSPLYPNVKVHEVPRQGATQAFLSSLEGMACESFRNDYPGMDSVRALVPFATMQVNLIERPTPVVINIYPNGIPVYSEFTGPVHRLFVDVLPGDFVGAQYQVIKGVLCGYDFFFEVPAEELVF